MWHSTFQRARQTARAQARPTRIKQPEDLAMVRKSLALAIALAFVLPGVSRADAVSDLQAQVQALQKQIDALKTQIQQVTTEQQADKAAQEKKNEQFLERK